MNYEEGLERLMKRVVLLVFRDISSRRPIAKKATTTMEREALEAK